MRLRLSSAPSLLRQFRTLSAPLTAVAALGLVACSSDTEGANNLTGGSLKVQLALGTAGKAKAQNARTGEGESLLAGHAGVVESLKYHINSIAICEGMDVNGSGFQNPSGCLRVYEGDLSSY
ncbi:MAG: hypothetical protein ABW133_24360, partial [Polyangiaceae bacterium]